MRLPHLLHISTVSRRLASAPTSRSIHSLFLLVVVLLTNSTVTAQDAAWGTLRGRFLFEGPLPAVEKLQIERDSEVCGLTGLVDESLVIHQENRGLQNVILWLESKTPVPVHPDYLNNAPKPARLDNNGCRFEPRVVQLRTGQSLELRNSDPVAHNAAAWLKRSTPFNEVIPIGQSTQRIIRKAETLPARVDCSIHAWMRAWLVVLDHPYSAVTDKDGRFELTNVPAGQWRIRMWHERPGNLTELEQDGRPQTLDKGALTLTIPADGELDLGDLKLTATQLKPKK